MSARENAPSPRQLQASASSATSTQVEPDVHRRSQSTTSAVSAMPAYAITKQVFPPAVANNHAHSDQPRGVIERERTSTLALAQCEVQAPSATATDGQVSTERSSSGLRATTIDPSISRRGARRRSLASGRRPTRWLIGRSRLCCQRSRWTACNRGEIGIHAHDAPGLISRPNLRLQAYREGSWRPPCVGNNAHFASPVIAWGSP